MGIKRKITWGMIFFVWDCASAARAADFTVLTIRSSNLPLYTEALAGFQEATEGLSIERMDYILPAPRKETVQFLKTVKKSSICGAKWV